MFFSASIWRLHSMRQATQEKGKLKTPRRNFPLAGGFNVEQPLLPSREHSCYDFLEIFHLSCYGPDNRGSFAEARYCESSTSHHPILIRIAIRKLLQWNTTTFPSPSAVPPPYNFTITLRVYRHSRALMNLNPLETLCVYSRCL